MLVHKLGLGTAQFGSAYGVSNNKGQVPAPDVAAILAQANQAGLGILDTAAGYGDAEAVVGAALPSDHEFQILTKTLPLTNGLEAVTAAVHESLERLRQKKLAGLLVHHADDLLGPDGPDLWLRLEALRDQGLFERLGVSIYGDTPVMALLERYPVDLVQLPVNLLDQRLLQDGTLTRLKDRGVEIHARSVFLQGLLLMDTATLPSPVAKAAPALHQLDDLVTEAGTTRLGAALHFVLSQPEIDAAIVGVTSVEELQDIVGAAETPHPPMNYAAAAIDDDALLNPSNWH